MVDRNFGLDVLARQPTLTRLLEKTDVIGSDSARILSMMAYDIDCGIHDHSRDNSSPLSLVAMHDAELYRNHSGLYHVISTYLRQGIHKHFGLSLTEYLEYPPDIVEIMTDIGLQAVIEEDKTATQVENVVEGRHGPKKHQ